jgi:hypothetical protein
MAGWRRFYPSYALPPASAFEPTVWQAVAESGETPVGPAWTHWDYNTRVRLRRQVAVDVETVRATCQLGPDRELRLVVAWRSTTTQLRGMACSLPVSGGGRAVHALDAELPSSELGGDVHLRTQLLVGSKVAGDGPLAASFMGSVVWEDEFVFRVEGGAPRFPMELVDFSATRLFAGAAWVLDWDEANLDAPFLSSVRLLINTAHPVVFRATTATLPDSADLLVRSVMKFDVSRIMVMAALRNKEFLAKPDGYEEGSVGRELRRLVRSLFGLEDLGSLAARAASMPGEFLAELQHKSQLLA